MLERHYRIRRSQAGSEGQQTVYRLTVPPYLAKVIPEDTEFTVEMTEEGLLYKPVPKKAKEKLPAWVKRS